MVSRLPDYEFERRLSPRLLDVLIRAGLIALLAVLCYQVFAPFLPLLAWAVILAVTMYPLHQWLARKLRGRQGLAAVIVVLGGVLLIIAPTALLMDSFGSSVYQFITAVKSNTLDIPAPRERVREWPFVGERVYDAWSQAHTDLPGLVDSLQPKIGELARKALAMVASIGIGLLKFVASFVIAGILMAYGEAGTRGSRAIFDRIIGLERGAAFARLSTATLRTVAQGVLGIAFVQATLVGLALLIAGVPYAGVWAAITLVLSVAQVPALIVTVPAIIYIWSSGHYGSGAAITHTIVLLIAGMVDNVLKPLLIGRGSKVPRAVILAGVLGGLLAHGLIGLFVGPIVLALGYELFRAWLAGPS